MLKRWTSVFLSVAMLSSLCSGVVFGAENSADNDYGILGEALEITPQEAFDLSEEPYEIESLANESGQSKIIKSRFIDADVTVRIENYVPYIEGTVSCNTDQSIVLNIVNETDGIVIANKTFSGKSYEYELSYQLPSLRTAKKCTVSIISKNAKENLMKLNLEINSSIALVSASGAVNLAEGVTIDANVKSVNTGLINKSTTISENKNVSFTLPNLVSNTSYKLTAQGYESVRVPDLNSDAVFTLARANNQGVTVNGYIGGGENKQVTLLVTDQNGKIVYIDQLTSGKEGFYTSTFKLLPDATGGTYDVKVGGTNVRKLAETTFNYNGVGGSAGESSHILEMEVSSGNVFKVCVIAKNIQNISGKEFTIAYDSSKLQIDDLLGQTFKKETTPGDYGDIEIVSVDNDEITFRVKNIVLSTNQQYNGVVNVIQFKAKVTGTSQTSVTCQ